MVDGDVGFIMAFKRWVVMLSEDAVEATVIFKGGR
jgi:hypothetical protein